jgi:iron complex transport system substrate-binding protein
LDGLSILKGVERMNKNITYIIAILAVAALVVATYSFIVFEGEISDLNGSINDLQGELATSQTTISNLESSLDTIEGQLTAIDTIEGQLDTIQDQLSVYHSAITELETQMGIYNSNMSALEQQLSEQQEQISEYQANITQLQEELSEYKEITLVDSMGNVVTFTEPPERIVSLSPSNTEILFAIGAGDNVVGVTDYCNYPYDFAAWVEAGNMTSIGNYWNPSVEPIVALEPDLVLASTGSLDAAATLKNLGYAVLVVEGHTIDEILEDILLVGRATYKNAEASALVIEMRARIDAVTTQLMAATSTPKVYYEVWFEPFMSAGPGTFIDEIITLAGGENIFNDATTSWPVVSSEEIITKDPDVMLFPDTYMGAGLYDLSDVPSRPGWSIITAVQNDAIYEIIEDTIVRSGPRVVDAIEAIAALIHPEIFGQP